ncbi:hypothetical protein LCGC14_2542920, partial [marine sediment metagenome]
MKNQNQDKIAQKLTDDIVNTYQDDSGINFIDVANLPVRDKVIELLDLLIELIFPGYMGKRIVTRDNVNSIVGDILVRIRTELAKQIELALRHQCRMANCPTCDCNKMAVEVTDY